MSDANYPSADYSAYVDATLVPRLSKQDCRMSFDAYPEPFERLVGMWKPLSEVPFRGITTDGNLIPALYKARSEHAPVGAAAKAASQWLDALDPDIRAKVCFPVDSNLWRHWQNTPLVVRHPENPQIELLDLPADMRELALEVVRASLSPEGYRRTRAIMANNQFMGSLIGMTEVLNEWAYTLSIFGSPSTSDPWGWQFFGHHLALNCFFIGDQMTLSPVFMGVEPDVEEGPERRRLLFLAHEQRALRFVNALTTAERTKAILYDSMLTKDQPPGRSHPDDQRHLGGAFRDNRMIPYEGVPVAGLDAHQRKLLLELAELFIANIPTGPAEARMQDIEKYLNQTHFAWIGPVDEVNPFYFRIQSPVVMIEFDHHSGIFLANQEPARFHVHTIIRSPNGGDYGRDLLNQYCSQRRRPT